LRDGVSSLGGLFDAQGRTIFIVRFRAIITGKVWEDYFVQGGVGIKAPIHWG
jgi:hypothetical protein